MTTASLVWYLAGQSFTCSIECMEQHYILEVHKKVRPTDLRTVSGVMPVTEFCAYFILII